MKVQFFGKILYKDEWVDINPESTIFDIPEDTEPFEFFKTIVGYQAKYLITYNEIKE